MAFCSKNREVEVVAKVQLTLACGDYELTRALADGTVEPEGIELVVLHMGSPERHWRMIRFEEFDVCELSLSSYLLCKAAGREFSAIPVFPHRRFRHSYIFCNVNSGIEKPQDLAGKKIGLRTLQVTAGVWIRGILEEEYGVPLRSIKWYTQDPEDLPIEFPKDLMIEKLPEGSNPDTMLVNGELDAVIYPETLPSIAKGDPRVKRLFTNYKAVEVEYYEKTGIFPIMHTVVIKNSILKEHPWVARNLLTAFTKAKEVCYKRMENPRTIALAWVMELLEEQKRILGPDPWPYNLKDNYKALKTFIRYHHSQGMIPRPFEVEELFVPSTVDTLPRYV